MRAIEKLDRLRLTTAVNVLIYMFTQEEKVSLSHEKRASTAHLYCVITEFTYMNEANNKTIFMKQIMYASTPGVGHTENKKTVKQNTKPFVF